MNFCVNFTQLTLPESEQRERERVAVCVAPFCGTSKSAQLLPGKNAETARKRKSQWQQHRHRQLIQLPCTLSARYDDISCADQRHTLTLTLQLPLDEPCLGQAKRSQNARREQPRASSQATCGTSGARIKEGEGERWQRRGSRGKCSVAQAAREAARLLSLSKIHIRNC